MPRKRYLILCFVVVLIVLLKFWMPGWIDRAYYEASSNAPVLFDGCRKAWAHRGFVGEGQENTVGSVQRAIERGATGVEVDILYDVKTDRFMISHDRPYQQVDGRTLTLDQLFGDIEADIYYWLDAKDLSDLWPWQAANATARLTAILEKHGLKNRVLVESRSPFYLARLAENGVLGILPPNTAKASEAPMFTGL